MQIRPEHPAVDMLDHLQQVVMIAPVDAQEDKAKHVAEKHRSDRYERIPTGVMRHFQFQHHDGDDDRNHSIAESFKPALSHSSAPLTKVDSDFECPMIDGQM